MKLARRHRWGPLAVVGALVGVLALTAAALPCAHPRDHRATASPPLGHDRVYSIALPDLPPTLPDGPNRPQFQAYCRLCHSPRLVLTQPRLPRDKWSAVVKKMVNVYKAPIPADQEDAVIAYLMAVRGSP